MLNNSGLRDIAVADVYSITRPKRTQYQDGPVNQVVDRLRSDLLAFL